MLKVMMITLVMMTTMLIDYKDDWYDYDDNDNEREKNIAQGKCLHFVPTH